jgi:DNA-binding transcriptional LysR family regulator
MGRQEGASLSVGVTPIIAHSLLPVAINTYRQRAPHVNITVHDCAPGELQQRVETGRLDAAFGAFFSKASGLDRHPVFASRLQVVSRVQHEPVPPASLPWTHLGGQALITLHESSPIQQLTDAQLDKLGLVPASRLCVNHLETVIAFAEAGLGMGVIPSFARAASRRYDVTVATLTPAIEFHYYRITRAGHHVSDTLQAFTQVMAEVAAAHEPTV